MWGEVSLLVTFKVSPTSTDSASGSGLGGIWPSATACWVPGEILNSYVVADDLAKTPTKIATTKMTAAIVATFHRSERGVVMLRVRPP